MLFRREQGKEGSPSRRNEKIGTPSLLSNDVKIEGDIVIGGDIYIGGSIKGRIVAHKLTLGEGGTIAGIVEAETAIIAGAVSGKLTANTVILKRTAHVTADITHVSLSIEPGGSFEGFSRRVDDIQHAVLHAEPVAIEPPLPALAEPEPKPS